MKNWLTWKDSDAGKDWRQEEDERCGEESCWYGLFASSQDSSENYCSHKIKRHLLLRRAMTNLDSTLKSRDITLQTEVHLVKAMVFPAVMYGCESWTIKKAEHQRMGAFELWCWRRLLRVSWAPKSLQMVTAAMKVKYVCSLEEKLWQIQTAY